MPTCVQCGVALPDNQGSRTCSMCYGDPDHGKDGLYQKWLEQEQPQPEEPTDAD